MAEHGNEMNTKSKATTDSSLTEDGGTSRSVRSLLSSTMSTVSDKVSNNKKALGVAGAAAAAAATAAGVVAVVKRRRSAAKASGLEASV